MAEMGERHLRSDYHLLEEAGRTVDTSRRRQPARTPPALPPALAALRHAASARGVELLFQPPGMEKREANRTHHDRRQRQDVLRWTARWRFAGTGVELATAPAAEDTPLREVLAQALEAGAPGQAQKAHELREFRDALAAGGAGGEAPLAVLLRAERRPANAPGYFLLGPGATVGEALRGKVVIEFPTFTVDLPGRLGGYPLLPSPPPAGAPRPPPPPGPPPPAAAPG